MNRKNLINSIFFILSSFITLPARADQKNDLLFNGTLALGAILATKGYSYLKQNSLEDVPTHYEQWARKFLADKGIKNADTIALKIDDCWTYPNEYFLAIDSNQAQKIENILKGKENISEIEKTNIFAQAEYSLLHEATRHNDNYMYKIIGAQAGALVLHSLLQEYEPSLGSIPAKMATMTALPIVTKKHLDQKANFFVKTSIGSLNIKVSDPKNKQDLVNEYLESYKNKKDAFK